jgi:preprotein translocase subunit SecB
MAEQLDPVFQIQRVYLKEASLEQPNSPQILLEQEQPTVDIQLGVDATPVVDGIFEVTVTATVTTKIKDAPCFWSRPSRPASLKSATCRKTRWA